MKTVKINLIVTVEISCTAPEVFKSSAEFENHDAKAMGPYLKEVIQERIKDAWQFNAHVSKSKVKVL
jgi:hypothetical protein